MRTEDEVLIVGGGIMGLAIALELKLRGTSVTVLSRDFRQAAAHAAAGMLAPQAEALPPGPMRDLSLQSLEAYPEWVRKIEDLSSTDIGYQACGILAPVYDAPSDTPNNSSTPARRWLDQTAIHLAQPGLNPDILGGWWLPEEGQVDNRALTGALRSAAESVGVTIHEGVAVTDVERRHGKVVGMRSPTGTWQAQHYILATGAWSQALLPVPVQPLKGQMISVAAPMVDAAERPLQQVLFGPDGLYLVPRRDGRIIVGATVEAVGFAPHNTPAGLQELLSKAMRLFPAIAQFPIQECWWGFRPTTPDQFPILGASPYNNLSLAIGHHRNGILLAPITAHLIANLVTTHETDPLLPHFSWERFLSPMVPSPATASPAPSSYSSPKSMSQPSTLPSATPTQTDLTVARSSDRPLIIAGQTFHSRLMTGTGKYDNFEVMQQSVAASGCEIVTVAVRRVQTKAPGHEGLAEALDWSRIWMLPNTAGCQTAEEAIRVARLGREMAKLLGQEDNNFVKLEVIPDTQYLLPDPIGTLEAAETLVKEGFAVLPYINADPLLAKRLEDVGCATVMPLGSPIGSGQGIRNTANIQIIIENAKVPVVVDAGIGTPSEAAQAMEMGADALLINTAIAKAHNPVAMAQAMGMATVAGRLAYLAGRIPVQGNASASSPLTGRIGKA
ncbi:glycine oxidase ThiO [filamentous cyanobacterium LEGE 07170]|nr:glycine oxidase ThiO [filamentous cyanobacterium LEGE 07170]